MASFKEKKNTTLKLVFSAIMSALSFVLMYIGSLSGIFDLCAVTIGAIGVVFAMIELRGMFPWLICSVVTILCFLFLPDKFSALEYLIIGGLYPILKSYIEKLNMIFSWLIKLIYFNVMLTASFFVAKYLFGITEDWMQFSVVVYLLGTVFFVIFDFALTSFVSLYFARIKPKLKIKF